MPAVIRVGRIKGVKRLAVLDERRPLSVGQGRFESGQIEHELSILLAQVSVERLAFDVRRLVGLALAEEFLEARFEARGHDRQRRGDDRDRELRESRLEGLDRFVEGADESVDVGPAVDVDVAELEECDIGLVADPAFQDRAEVVDLREGIGVFSYRRMGEDRLPEGRGIRSFDDIESGLPLPLHEVPDAVEDVEADGHVPEVDLLTR